MTRVLNKIKSPITDGEVGNININFDRIALDLSDRSGVFSSTAFLNGLVVPAGQTRTIEINILDELSIYSEGRLPVIPRFDAYVDNDLNGSYLYPSGSGLTQANVHGIDIFHWNSRSIFNQATNEKATAFMVVKNNDAGSHTFYIYMDFYYVPAPDQGIAVRDQ